MVKISEATFAEGPDEVQGESRAFVGAEHEPGVGRAFFGGEAGVVDDVTAITWEFDATANLGGGAAGFGVLTCDASDADDAFAGAADEYEAHLDEHFEFPQDGGAAAVVEAFGTVAALENKGLPGIDLLQLSAESVDLPGSDERGELCEGPEDGFELFGILIFRLLEGRFGGPGAWRPRRHGKLPGIRFERSWPRCEGLLRTAFYEMNGQLGQCRRRKSRKGENRVFLICGRSLGAAGCGGIEIAEARFPKHLTQS